MVNFFYFLMKLLLKFAPMWKFPFVFTFNIMLMFKNRLTRVFLFREIVIFYIYFIKIKFFPKCVCKRRFPATIQSHNGNSTYHIISPPASLFIFFILFYSFYNHLCCFAYKTTIFILRHPYIWILTNFFLWHVSHNFYFPYNCTLW